MSKYSKASFLEDFEIPEITHETIKSNLVKLNRNHAVIKNKSIENLPLDEKLKFIQEEVYRVLGRYKGFVKVIDNYEDLDKYIDFAISKGYLALDTETNKSLDPLTCKIMGLCLYVPNTRPVYVPISHTKPGTYDLLPNQVSISDASKIMQKLKDSDIKIIYHNGKFDIRVVYNTLGVYLPIWWDTMLAAQMIDENDVAKLKNQYQRYVNPTMDTYSIEKLFSSVPYEWVDVDIFALYSAIDAYDTYKLQQFQEKLFNREKLQKLEKLFLDIEVPVTEIVARMEDTGITLNIEFVNRLNAKYEKGLEKATKKLDDLLLPYMKQIKVYQDLGQLDNPVNYSSPSQLQLLLYDVMGTPKIDGMGKATDKSTLKLLNTPFTKAILEQRHYSKLISSFTATLPTLISKKDGKIHASFNQMGKEENNVRTGRFSSTDPNLQQIPSHEKTMRLMFEASPGYVIVGGDFSQQEPRLLTHMCQDQNLIDTYNNNKDLYATIGSFVFHKDYWECMEHWEDGSPNPTGKSIRSKCKQIVLGTMYGMGAKLLATMLKVDIEECKNILDEFFRMFPTVKNFISNNEKMAREQGYVEDYLGRRRHLPDAQLPELSLKAKRKEYIDDSIFFSKLTDNGYIEVDDEELTRQWEKFLKERVGDSKSYKVKEKFKESAKENGIIVRDNGAFISKAMTQSTNARIQGGAASLTKKAMIKIFNDQRLKELGFRILIPVHDELLGECPVENAEEVAKLLSQDMIESAKPECSVNMKCDCYVVHHWYSDEVENQIHEDYETLTKGDVKKGIKAISIEEAISKLSIDYPELSKDTLISMCEAKFDHLNGHL